MEETTRQSRVQSHAKSLGDSAQQPKPVDQLGLSYWLALWRVKGVGPVLYRELLERYQDPFEVFCRSPQELFKAGFSKIAVAEIQSFIRKEPDSAIVKGVNADLLWLSRPHNSVITSLDPAYPPLLKAISDHPPLLFVCGSPELLSLPQIAIVGSRNASQQGMGIAGAFAGRLAESKVIPTSGLAFGIDSAAHRGALDVGLPTIAVVAHGMHKIYPAGNKALARKIARCGAVVSEFSIGTEARPAYFPRRNRIISGLSLGVLVVEAALKSGSLLTANFAAEQGREVFAVPGSIHNPLAKGCHGLIRQGAKLVETVEDIIEELAPLLGFQSDNITKADELEALASGQDTTKDSESAAAGGHGLLYDGSSVEEELVEVEVSIEEQFLLTNLTDVPISIDALVARSKYTVASVSSLLVQLQIKGLAQAVHGGYVRADEI